MSALISKNDEKINALSNAIDEKLKVLTSKRVDIKSKTTNIIELDGKRTNLLTLDDTGLLLMLSNLQMLATFARVLPSEFETICGVTNDIVATLGYDDILSQQGERIVIHDVFTIGDFIHDIKSLYIKKCLDTEIKRLKNIKSHLGAKLSEDRKLEKFLDDIKI